MLSVFRMALHEWPRICAVMEGNEGQSLLMIDRVGVGKWERREDCGILCGTDGV